MQRSILNKTIPNENIAIMTDVVTMKKEST